MARRTLLTPDTQSAILEALNLGNYIETAAQYAGISVTTMYNWLDRGRSERQRLDENPDAEPNENETKYVEFLEAVEKTRSKAETRAIGLIQKAASDGTWQAAAWFLERSFPARWGRKQNVELTGEGGGSVKVEHVSTEALENKVREILDGES